MLLNALLGITYYGTVFYYVCTDKVIHFKVENVDSFSKAIEKGCLSLCSSENNLFGRNCYSSSSFVSDTIAEKKPLK